MLGWQMCVTMPSSWLTHSPSSPRHVHMYIQLHLYFHLVYSLYMALLHRTFSYNHCTLSTFFILWFVTFCKLYRFGFYFGAYDQRLVEVSILLLFGFHFWQRGWQSFLSLFWLFWLSFVGSVSAPGVILWIYLSTFFVIIVLMVVML